MSVMLHWTRQGLIVLSGVGLHSMCLAKLHVQASRMPSSCSISVLWSAPCWYVNARNRSCFSERRHDHQPVRHVDATHEYLRNNEKYASTTYRGYDQAVRLLGLDVAVSSRSDLATYLLQKLGCSSFIQSPFEMQAFAQHLEICDERLVRYLNRQELLALILLFASWNMAPSGLRTTIITSVDSECARRVTLWNCETCLLAFDLWIAWLGHAATRKLFFAALLREWQFSGFVDDYNHLHYSVQLLYYIGLKKAAPQKLLLVIRSALEKHVSLLTTEELSIVCQGYFKSHQKLNSPLILQSIVERLKTLLEESNVINRHLLVDFLKVLRHARHEDLLLCEAFAKFLRVNFVSEQNSSDLIQCAHYAAFFATSRYYDRELFCLLEKIASISLFSAVINLEEIYDLRVTACCSAVTESLENIRMKDLTRILWSFSEVFHVPLHADFIKGAISYITWYWKQGSTNCFQSDLFVDCLHSLAIIGIFPDCLQEWMMHLETLESSLNQKVVHKMVVVRESMRIEKSLCWKSSLPNAGDYGEVLHRYWNLDRILPLVATLCNGNETLYRRVSLLPHIPIPGLELHLDNQGQRFPIRTSRNTMQINCIRVAVEVLEPTKCLKNCHQTVGLWIMKIRQLEKLGYRVVKIWPSQVEQLEKMPTEERIMWFKQHLLENLSLVGVNIL